MIIAGFDGRNITALFDAVELKTINEFLKFITPDQVSKVTASLKASGFAHANDSHCAALATAIDAVGATLLNSINLNVEDTEVEDEDDGTVTVKPKKKKKAPELVN